MPKLMVLAGAFLVLMGVTLLRRLGHMLFSVHMAQHLLLIAVAAPLFAYAGVRIRVSPLAGWTGFVAIFLFWHWPEAFRWAAGNRAGEFLEFASLLAAAVCFWSGMFEDNQLSHGARALLVMTAAVLTDLPGVMMLFSPHAICTMPRENAALFGLTPLQDQQLAGLLMWVPTNLVFFGIAVWLFARWMSFSQPPTVTS
jgi:putative membrane protein